MPFQNKRNIGVFIASPNDLAQERKDFREKIEELNHGFGDGAGVIFEALGWEDTLSSVGRRNQSVINREIDRCDVFVLVLRRRWGQEAPDSEYSSYTEEEFYRALERFRSEGAPEIFIFFKRISPDSEADPGPQLQMVMTFRRMLEDSREVLYRYIDDDSNPFAGELDVHLRAYTRGDLPSKDLGIETPILPLSALDAIREAQSEAACARQEAEKANDIAEKEIARALELALEIAQDAAEAALEGKVEKARQRFAKAIAGTTSTKILRLAFAFYRRTGDFEAAEELVQRWSATSVPGSEDQVSARGNLGVLKYLTGDLDTAEIIMKETLEEARSAQFESVMTDQYGNLGIIYQERGELDKAEEMLTKAIAVATRLDQDSELGKLYGNLGLVHKDRGDLIEAERLYRKALEIDEKVGRKEGPPIHYGNLGIVSRRQDKSEEAESLFLKALALNQELSRKEGMAIQYGNLGLVFLDRGELNEAEDMFRQALLIDTKLGRREGLAIHTGNLGEVYLERGDLAKAEESCRHALDMNKALKRRKGMATQFENLGRIHAAQGQTEKSRGCWEHALKLYEQIGAPDVERIQKYLQK